MLDYRDLMALAASEDRQTLTARTVSAAERLGFGLCSGVLIRGRFDSSAAVVESFGNPPESYRDNAQSRDQGLRDPLLARLLSAPGHVTYDQAFYVQAGAADLWDVQAPFGYRCGLSWSSHAPGHGQAFLFGLDSSEPVPRDRTRLLQMQAALQLLAVHAQAALERITAPRADAELLPSEREALQLEGARIYARRSSGAGRPSLALVSATAKLSARSSQEAVLRAISDGQIPL